MSLVAFPVILEMDYFLALWLKDVPNGAATFCRLMILGSLVGCLGEGIPALVNATGNIKMYQIITHSFTLLGLPISFFCYKYGANPYTILVVFLGISFCLAFIRLYLLKRIFDFDVRAFFNVAFVKIAIMSIPMVIFYMLYDTSFCSALGHVIGLTLSEIFLVVIILLFGMGTDERRLLKGLVSKKYRK